MKGFKTLKEINHKVFVENYEYNDRLQQDRCLLERLYHLHLMAWEFLDLDENVKDRVLKTIKREQVKLENKKYLN